MHAIHSLCFTLNLNKITIILSGLRDTDSEVGTNVQSNTKKRKETGRMSEVMKNLRATTHETGSDWNWSRYKCFEIVSLEERKRIIKNFNNLDDYNAQNQYLGGLVSGVPVQQRRNRNDYDRASSHISSYCYCVRAKIDGTLQDVRICYKGFYGYTALKIAVFKL